MTTETIEEKIERSRTELLDLSLRNPLVNYRLLRAKGVEAAKCDSSKVFKSLVREHRLMRFTDVDSRSTAASSITTGEESDQLERRLLKTFRDANTLIQEQGVNTLFVAIGMIRWYESDSSEIERKAPLVLIPVEMERATVNTRFGMRYSDEELDANIAFIQKAQQDFGLTIPGLADDDEADAEDLNITAYFSGVSRSLKEMSRWSVDRDSVVLGFFSFNKLLMYKDLDPESWPEGNGILERRIIHALFEEGFNEPASEINDEAFLDNHLRADDVFHVVDADSSQAKAIHDVNRGRTLVIQGPPGTGKSQTITNIIAESVGQGKTVLFVAEKMAALEVVKHRLDSIGIGDACLELHSRKTQKRAAIDELKRTLELGEPDTEGIDDDFALLNDIRGMLNEYAAAVNTTVGDTGVTPYDAYGHLMRLYREHDVASFPRLRVPGIDSWTGSDFQRKATIVSEIQTILGSLGVPKGHIFRGSNLRVVTPLDEADLRESVAACIKSLETLTELNLHLSDLLGLDTPEDITQLSLILPLARRAAQAPDINGVNLKALRLHSSRNDVRELLDYHERIEALHAEFDSELKSIAWGTDVSEIYAVLSATKQTDWARLIAPDYRRARNQLAELQGDSRPGDIDTLNRLAELSASLSESLGLDGPDNVNAIEPIICLAERTATAPDLRGVNLEAFESPKARREMQETLNCLGRLDQLHSEYDAVLKPDAWSAELVESHRVLSTTGRSSWKRLLSRAYRRAKNQVSTLCRMEPPSDIEEQIVLVKSIMDEQQIRSDIARLRPTAEAAIGNRWQGEESDREAIEPIVEWAVGLLEDIDAGDIDSKLAFTMTDDVDSGKIGGLLPDTREALASHKTNAEIEWSKARVEYQLAVIQAIASEQNARQKIELLAPTAEAVLGSLWCDEDPEEKAVAGVLKWIVALLDDIDAKEVRTAIALNMSDSIDADRIRDTLSDTQSMLESHVERIAHLATVLNIDSERQFGDAGGLASLSFSDQLSILADWAAGVAKVREVASYNSVVANAEDESLDDVVELVWEWKEASKDLSACFANARFSSIISRAMVERSSIGKFNADIHTDRIGKFRSMDELSLLHNRARVSHAHWSQMPKFGGLGQLGILHREFAKKRRHLPIRQLMDQAGNAIQAIKPVFMMSPLSVATYLKPGVLEFDLIIFDEASQVKPVDALGALIRGRQSVVVGDDKQLPPTDFFNSVNQDDAENESVTADIESILSLFSAQGAPNRMLQWHYRSRHESLIAVSNQEFYDNRLVVFPSPESRTSATGLQYHWLETQYARGGVNRQEAKYVAEAVIVHAREHADLSLGVATFSASQRDAVEDELEVLRRQNEDCESFFNAHPDEPFFVKNLENVQGDERDVIFISVGYGRNSSGRVNQNFGPLNREGGERRLNVLISRAKQRCEVFTNLHAEDIRLMSNSRHGVQAFKKFLAYAESGTLADAPMSSGKEAASPFQKEVADSLRSLGYEIHDEVSSSGFFVDIGVVDPDHPGRYILGIECDGAAYHSSRSARERDRLRELVLVGLGWRVHRIWSTDYFNNPQRELKRASAAIEEALEAQRNSATEDLEDKSEVEADGPEKLIQRAESEQGTEQPVVPPYTVANPRVVTWPYELGDAPLSSLRDPIIEVVAVESPVHEDDVIRRITNAAGLRRVGSRIQEKLSYAIDTVVRLEEIYRKGSFLWSKNMPNAVVRDRSSLDGQQRKLEYVSPEEFAEAVIIVVTHSYGIERDDIATPTVRLLGFKSASSQAKTLVDSVVDSMLKEGKLESDGRHLTPP